MSDKITTELVWLPAEGFDMEALNDYGWLLVTDGVKLAPAFVGYRMFSKKPKWCSAITRTPLTWQPTHIAYPTFPSPVTPT